MKILFIFLTVLFPVAIFAKTEWPPDSIYHVSSVWLDQDKNSLQLNKFSGKFVIVAMVYTKCAHACPMTINKIQEVERQLQKRKITNYQVVLASFDTKRDTPSHLKTYMKKRDLNANTWSFLSTDRDSSARELAVVLGINYKLLEDGEYSHSNVISVLNENGVRIAKIESLTADIAPLLKAFSK